VQAYRAIAALSRRGKGSVSGARQNGREVWQRKAPRVAQNRKHLVSPPKPSVLGDSWSAVLGRVALILLFVMLIAVGFFMRHA